MDIRREDWPRVKAMFEAALALDNRARAAYLADVCRDDLVVRRHVETLLASHDKAGTFLEAPQGVTRDPQDDLTGRTIGTYRIDARLGAGGMGDVYRAHDSKLARFVALKLLSLRVASDPERLRRFHSEAHAVSSLNHPNILVIHDFGELDGRPFIVSELVEGVTLRDRIAAGPLAVRNTVEIAVQVASALAAAHAKGIVHRDIKPENIMIRPDGYVKVLDFGLAKLTTSHETGAESMVRTQPGIVMGTPRYMSPEQARGLSTDTRTDIWSIGVVLYEMIAGRRPFESATMADVIAAILTSEPELLEVHVPEALAHIVSTTLAKDPDGRYASALELHSALVAVRTGIDSPQHQRADHVHGLHASHDVLRSPAVTKLVVVPFTLLRPDADIDFLPFGLADAIAISLSGLPSLVVRSTMSVARVNAASVDFRTLARDADVDVVLTGTLLRAGDRLRLSAQLMSAADERILWSQTLDVSLGDVFQLQDDLCQRIVESLALPLSARDQRQLRKDVPANARAYELYLRANNSFYHAQDWTVARELYVECLREDPNYAPAWARVGRCYRLTAKFQAETEAAVGSALQQAEHAFQRAFAVNPDLAVAHYLYTALECDLGRAPAAMQRLLRQAAHRPSDPELFAGLVHACRYAGLTDASIAAHHRARHLDARVPTSVANTYLVAGDFARAAAQPDWAINWYFRGIVLATMGRHEEAVALLRERDAAPGHQPGRAYWRPLLAWLENRPDDCLVAIETVLPLNSDPESRYYVGRLYAAIGRSDAALDEISRGIDMGYCAAPALRSDPWVEPLRSLPRFAEITERAQALQAANGKIFDAASGPRVLGMPAP